MKKKAAPTAVFKKRAAIFRNVMAVYAQIRATPSLKAMRIAGTKGAQPFAGKVTPLDFVIDVDRQLERIPEPQRTKIKLVYGRINFDDDLLTEIYSERVLHGAQAGLIQGIGKLFEEAELTVGVDGFCSYFKCVRQTPAGIPEQTVQPPAIPLFRDAGTNEIAKKYRKLRAKVPIVQELETEAEPIEANAQDVDDDVDLFQSEIEQTQELLDPVEIEHDSLNQNYEVAFAD